MPSVANPARSDSKKTPLDLYRKSVAAGKLTADAAQADLMERLDHLARRIDSESWFSKLLPSSRNENAGIYIWGGVGRGKSMLMDMFFTALQDPRKERIHFHRFMAQVHAALFELRQTHGEGDPLPRIARDIATRCKVLCFDEFQVTDIADAMILSRLFTALFERGVHVVFTSNRAPQELYAGGLQRESFLPFVELLKKRVEITELKSQNDYRIERVLALHDVYHTLPGAQADQFLDATWRLLCDKGGESATVLHQGRALIIPRACGNAAFFQFDDLCSQPLSASDYLALCDHYQTFVIAGIPKMNRDSRDAAKRFVTLIDVLYEAHAKLICTAEGEPAELYPSGDGSFEFARTVSRLAEMRSAEYLRASQRLSSSLN